MKTYIKGWTHEWGVCLIFSGNGWNKKGYKGWSTVVHAVFRGCNINKKDPKKVNSRFEEWREDLENKGS